MSRKVPVWDSHKNRLEYKVPEAVRDFDRYVMDIDISKLPDNYDTNNVKCVNGKIQPLSSVELKEKDNVKLEQHKYKLCRRVDDNVRKCVSSNSFGKQCFSMSQTAQLKWSGLYNLRDILEYPVSLSNKDDSKVYKIKDADEIKELYGQLVNTTQALLKTATSTKKDIQSAKDLESATETLNKYLNG